MNPFDEFIKGIPPTDSDHERRRKHKRLLTSNERELLGEQEVEKRRKTKKKGK